MIDGMEFCCKSLFVLIIDDCERDDWILILRILGNEKDGIVGIGYDVAHAPAVTDVIWIDEAVTLASGFETRGSITVLIKAFDTLILLLVQPDNEVPTMF